MIKDLIRRRLYQATSREVVQYSHEYGIPLTMEEASALLNFIKNEKVDPFSQKDRLKTLQYIELQFGKEKAHDAEKLLNQLIDQFNIHHLM
ncbi:DUF2624 family protein [Alkalibacillus salilacus]|uniref:DUF2624 domain-containing protein n=1 Tax=Alkalibacillus salilacus TaxID=284582 RepID=A0ABT9VCJ0_9BACI|nr:DUF2624 family protein [Alkalibacillus salilacus]MDQ0158642.1 hypothetical protein [Alkalibacillus salilacus]